MDFKPRKGGCPTTSDGRGARYSDAMRHTPLPAAAAGTVLLVAACGSGDDSGQDDAGQDDSGQEDAGQDDVGQGTSEHDDEQSGDPGESEPDDPDGDAVSEASWEPESTHVLVNKVNPLEPADHEPSDLTEPDVPMEFEGQQLREEAAAALEDLFAAAEDDDVDLMITTAYRGYDHQLALYESYEEEKGRDAADDVSARPGYSEHQTGLAADFSYDGNDDCYLSTCFGDTEAGQWLAEHAHEHGFVVRYPEDTQEITGFSYEPWHLRYVGEESAADVVEQGVTLEEYWGQPAAPDYQD